MLGVWHDTTASTCHSQDATAFATLAGVGGASRATLSLAYLSKTLSRAWGNSFVDADCFGSGTSDRVYGFISYPEVRARCFAGDDAGALEQLRRTWGWMINREPGNTVWEGVGAGGDIANYEGAFTSMAHGWAAGAAPALVSVARISPLVSRTECSTHRPTMSWVWNQLLPDLLLTTLYRILET